MKAYNPKDWFSLIFDFHGSYSFRMLFPAISILILYTAGLCYLDIELHILSLKSTTVLHSLLGFVISLLLVFRTNTAYDRWWEGRKLWGDLVNNTRNLAMKLSAILNPNQHQELLVINSLIINFVISLKNHLRSINDLKCFDNLLERHATQLSKSAHLPNTFAKMIHEELLLLRNSKVISDENLIFINEEVRSLTNITGACERIKATPIPYSYSMFIKRFIFLYTITLPLGLVHDFEWVSIPMVVFVFYAFASLELIAEEIEDPFGIEDNDLPIDDITLTISKNLMHLVEN
jgi:putative membrane protein